MFQKRFLVINKMKKKKVQSEFVPKHFVILGTKEHSKSFWRYHVYIDDMLCNIFMQDKNGLRKPDKRIVFRLRSRDIAEKLYEYSITWWKHVK